MSDVVLSVENVSKRFRIGAKPHAGTLREAISAAGSAAIQAPGRFLSRRADGVRTNDETLAKDLDEFWALRDVSFEVRRGEVLGIIGRNGAGKSTLLKIISRITEPTTGRVGTRGRVGSLLEVGTGFHPELTGRENIFLNGAILGMSRRDVRRRFDEIVAFAELDRFIDTPVKRYSSGMYVRLGFAVAAHLEPEILIVDEVLAVGDASFQQKCIAKIHSLVAEEGRTVLLVSHNAATLNSLCDKGIYFSDGILKSAGDVAAVLRSYFGDWNAKFDERHEWRGIAGDDELALLWSSVATADGRDAYDTGQDLEISAEIEVGRELDDLFFGIRLFSEYGHELIFSLHDDGEPPPSPRIAPGRRIARWRIPADSLAEGRYRVAFFLGVGFTRRAVVGDAGTLIFTLRPSAFFARRFATPSRQGFTSLLRPRWALPERDHRASAAP